MEIRIDKEWALHHLPRRPRNAHKGTFGTLLCLVGSRPYRGAAVLAVDAALRAGTGLVRLASIEAVCAAAATTLPACVLFPTKETEQGSIDASSLSAAMDTPHTAILAGCGITATTQSTLWLLSLLQKTQQALVLDADALNILAGHVDGESDAKIRTASLELLSRSEVPVILTPHLGEMARLVDLPVEELAQNAPEIACEFAQKHACTLVLKSHETLVATADEKLFSLRDFGNPGLAKAGSGDVLAGIIAGLLAQGFPTDVAAALGVFLHAQAGQVAVQRYGEAGLSPSDLPLCLAEVWRALGR